MHAGCIACKLTGEGMCAQCDGSRGYNVLRFCFELCLPACRMTYQQQLGMISWTAVTALQVLKSVRQLHHCIVLCTSTMYGSRTLL